MRRRVVTHRGLHPILLAAWAALGSAGCGPGEAESTASSYEAIVYGRSSGPEDDSVVLVQTQEPSGPINNCSGTLVASNLLLTARHCVSEYEDGAFTCSADGELQHAVGLAGVMGDLVPPQNIHVRAGAVPDPAEVAHGEKVFVLATQSICRNDIALVLLDRKTDLPVAPLRLTTATRHDELMRPVGYGSDEGNDALERRTKDDVAVIVIGPSEYWPEAGLAPPRTFAIGVSACQGDSGGPAFTKKNAVAGVYSLAAGECTSPSVRNYYTQLAPFEDLVREAFEAAGAEPLLEAEMGAAGASGAASAAHGAGSAGAAGTWAAVAGMAPWAGSAGRAGTPDSGATAGRAGASSDAGNAGEVPEYRGPRKKGGCRCGVVGAGCARLELTLLVAVGASALGFRRNRWASRIRTSRSRERPPGRRPTPRPSRGGSFRDRQETPRRRTSTTSGRARPRP